MFAERVGVQNVIEQCGSTPRSHSITCFDRAAALLAWTHLQHLFRCTKQTPPQPPSLNPTLSCATNWVSVVLFTITVMVMFVIIASIFVHAFRLWPRTFQTVFPVTISALNTAKCVYDANSSKQSPCFHSPLWRQRMLSHTILLRSLPAEGSLTHNTTAWIRKPENDAALLLYRL